VEEAERSERLEMRRRRKRYGGLEVRCRRRDVEVFASRAPELWRCDAGV